MKTLAELRIESLKTLMRGNAIEYRTQRVYELIAEKELGFCDQIASQRYLRFSINFRERIKEEKAAIAQAETTL